MIGPIHRPISAITDILFLLRRDGESRKWKWDKKDYIVDDWDKNMFGPLDPDYTGRAIYRTMDGMKFIARGRVVVTDRLHAHIFCTLMGIPHVILDNNNGKLFSYYKTYSHITGSAVQLARNITEAEKKAKELLYEHYNIVRN